MGLLWTHKPGASPMTVSVIRLRELDNKRLHLSFTLGLSADAGLLHSRHMHGPFRRAGLQLYLLIQLLDALRVVLVLPAGPHRPPKLVVEALRRPGDCQRRYEQLLLQVALTDAPAQSAQQRFTAAPCQAAAER